MLRGANALPGLAAAAASVFFGATVVAVRFVVDQSDPLTVAVFRHTIGTALILPVLLVFRSSNRIDRGDWLPISLLGIAMFGLFSFCSAGALQTIQAARGALILTTMPLFTLLLATLFRQERFTPLKLGGVVLTIVGVAVALGSSAELAGAPGVAIWQGDLFMFAASMLGALFNAFSPRYLRKYPPPVVTAYAMLAGTMFLLVLSAGTGVVQRFSGFTPLGWVAIGFVGALGAAGGFLLWNWALTHMTPTRVVVYLSLNPLAATILGALLLSEPVTLWFLVGLACVLAGIYLVNFDRKPACAPAATPLPSNAR